MADYPRNIPAHIESVNVLVDRAMVTELRGGGVKMRRLFAGPKRAFQVVHHGLTFAQLQALENFLALNRSLVFTLYVPRATVPKTYIGYAVIWVDSEVHFTDEGNRLAGCTINLRAV